MENKITRKAVRLECLKLVYTHGRDVAEAVSRAQVLEDYVFGAEDEAFESGDSSEKKSRKVRKSVDNSGDLKP